MTIEEAKKLLQLANDTINRLGAATQDCKTCKKLTICNAYSADGEMHDCKYKWIHADEVSDEER